MDAGAADEIEEEGLDIVIAVMGDTDGLCALLCCHLSKPLVAQVTRGHLDADAVALCVAACAEVLDAEGYVMGVAEAATEGFIAIAGGAAQLKVAVQGMNGIAQLMQGQQQGHAVSATAKGYEEGIAILQDGSISQYFLYGREEGGHEFLI